MLEQMKIVDWVVGADKKKTASSAFETDGMSLERWSCLVVIAIIIQFCLLLVPMKLSQFRQWSSQCLDVWRCTSSPKFKSSVHLLDGALRFKIEFCGFRINVQNENNMFEYLSRLKPDEWSVIHVNRKKVNNMIRFYLNFQYSPSSWHKTPKYSNFHQGNPCFFLFNTAKNNKDIHT